MVRGWRGWLRLAIVCLAIVVPGTSGADGARAHDPTGLWAGLLLGRLHLVLHVRSDSSGALAASLDSPDQGAYGLAVSAVSFRDDTLRLELERLGARFDGRLDAAGSTISGDWTQGGQSLPLELARTDSVALPRRPQVPQPPYPYVTEDVRYAGGGAAVMLAGTLTRPTGLGPFPCALMITGSGAEDRDEQVFGHRPFLVIADHLARHGIAVLRVDDRGVGGSTGSMATATSEDFAADAEAGLRFLAARPELDAKRLGLIGHSEGGLIAPMVAARSHRVAFIVLLAGPGLPGKDILLRQGTDIRRAMGLGESTIAKQRRLQEKVLAIMDASLDSAAVGARVREVFASEGFDTTQTRADIRAATMQVRSPWLQFFARYDPRPALRRVRCPVLALNGAKDLQVAAKPDLAEIDKALRAGGNRQSQVRELPGLNHLFQHCATGLPTEYSAIEETFAPDALELMTHWIRAHTGLDPAPAPAR